MEYLGIIEKRWHNEERGDLGRIRVLARLLETETGGLERDPDFRPRDLGETEMVFLPDATRINRFDLGTPVRFGAERNLKTKPGHDEYQVSKGRNGYEIEKIGVNLVVDAKHVPRWRQRPRRVETASLPNDVVVYLRLPQDGTLIGPWKLDRAELSPLVGKSCDSFAAATVVAPSRVESTDADGAPAFYLLNRLPEDQGEPVDLADGKQLAEWLLELTRESELKQTLRELDQRHPGWHDLLRDAFEEREDPARLRLRKERWQRIDDILRAIRFDAEHLEELVKRPPFKELWTQAVEELRTKLEKQAEESAAPRREKLDAELEALAAKVEEHHAVLEDAEHRLAEQERCARELRGHFEDDRQRLLRDFVAYQAVVGAAGAAVVPATSAPGPLLNELLITPLEEPEPPAGNAGTTEITCHSFVRRLAICIARRHGAVPFEVCTLFHAAMLAVRALLVPHSGWSRAYAEAMAPAARLASIQVEPHWLRSVDFRAAGFGEFWQAASEDSDRLYLLHIEDLDRALPELWLRPCLDLLAGFRDCLPEGGAWPENLRLLASFAPDAAGLPLSPFVAGCFAALPRFLDAGPSLPTPAVDGPPPHSMTFARWYAWRREGAEEEPPPPPLPPLELDLLRAGVRPAVEADLRRLAVALRAQGLGPLDVEQRSHQLRVVWPEQYLSEKDDDGIA